MRTTNLHKPRYFGLGFVMAESKQARSGLPAGAVALNKFVPAFDGRLFMVSATSDGLILLHNADQIFVVNMPFVTDLGVRNCGMVAVSGLRGFSAASV